MACETRTKVSDHYREGGLSSGVAFTFALRGIPPYYTDFLIFRLVGMHYGRFNILYLGVLTRLEATGNTIVLTKPSMQNSPPSLDTPPFYTSCDSTSAHARTPEISAEIMEKVATITSAWYCTLASCSHAASTCTMKVVSRARPHPLPEGKVWPARLLSLCM